MAHAVRFIAAARITTTTACAPAGRTASRGIPPIVSRPMCILRGTLLRLALGLVAPLALHAQAPADSGYTIAGIVRDTSGALLSAVEVRAGEQLTLTNREGRFVLPNLRGDSILVRVRRIGYQPVETVMAMRPNVRRIEIGVRLEPSVVELGTIVVEEKRLNTRLWNMGFYQRQKLGLGTYFDSDYLARHGGSYAALMMEVPSVRAVQSKGATIPIGPAGGMSGGCAMRVFLDGTFIPWVDVAGLEGVISKDELLAVEVYSRPVDVPIRVAGVGTASGLMEGASPTAGPGGMPIRGVGSVDCGAILLWSKPFEKKTK